MRYARLMVCLQVGAPHDNLLGVVASLAERFQAGVIGISGCQLTALSYGDGYATADTHESLKAALLQELGEAEAAFRRHFAASGRPIEWRQGITEGPIAHYLAAEARAADLVIMDAPRGESLVDDLRRIHTADIVMNLGRPVLIVPSMTTNLSLDRILVGWKDTPETRRAVSTTLPMLRCAENVLVVEVTPPKMHAAAAEGVRDVVEWLRCHGVKAEGAVHGASGDPSLMLETLMYNRGADIMVAGAYGHSRLGETLFGGVTDYRLNQSRRCSLLVH